VGGNGKRGGGGASTFRRFLAYYGPQRTLFWADMLCALAVAAIDLAFPQILRSLTNGLFAGASAEILQALTILLVGLLAMYALRYACRYFVCSWGHIMGVRMESRMREDLFAQYERFSFGWYDRVKTGDLVSRLVNDLFDISEAAHHGPENIVISTIEIVGMLVIMLTINVPLAVAIALVTAVAVAYLVVQNGRLQGVFRDNRLKISGVNASLEDSLQGMRVVKSFVAEDFERERFAAANDAYLASKTRTYKAMGTFVAMSSTLSGLLYTVVIVLGGYLVATGGMQVGDLAIFALYIGILATPIETLINFTETFQKAAAGFRRFCEVLDTRPDVENKPGAPDLEVAAGSIDFDDVSFSYDGATQVIDHLNLHVAAGTTVALVGPSGGGKTTTCSLVPRFYDVAAGAVRVDGIDVRDVTMESLRRSVGVVQQDVYLFDGTIAQNIAYGRPDATLDEIVAAAREANLHDFVSSLPLGYDTPVGEHGARLSGGQKQRVSIARVFLKNPPIIILDEATSALDNESERAVQTSLARLARGRTVLVIAHRLSTIKNADVIVAMEGGRVAEMGTHDELLAKGGLYARYYRMQFQGLVDDAAAGGI
jgi:ATP-binding cassette subfamily B protein